MRQFARVAPLAASTALWLCAVGCDSFGKKKEQEPVEPPVMGRSEEETALARAQLPMSNAGEVELVESAQRYRQQYRQSLESLLAYYRRLGYYEKGNWAKKEIRELEDVTRYHYLGDPIASSPKYAPKENVGSADELYAQARKLHEEATGIGGMLVGGKKKLAQALSLYRQIIDDHPTSDKIDDAAFYAGEIYGSDTYGEHTMALNFYQRCLKWNPNTNHPVRFRMAVLYDYQLQDREKALALYKEVVDLGKNRSNVRFSQDRIRQITDRASHEAPDVEPAVR